MERGIEDMITGCSLDTLGLKRGAATFLTLGYGELAAADAYKAHLLCNAASVEAMKARESGDGSLTAKVFNTILSKFPQAEHQSLEVYYPKKNGDWHHYELKASADFEIKSPRVRGLGSEEGFQKPK